MDLIVNSDGTGQWQGRRIRCALGRSGVTARKNEGDGATPRGAFVLRCVLFRPDREAPPLTALPCQALDRADGWCDAPADPAYNRLIRLPYKVSAETLWREDHVYDLIVPLGYNDDPVVPGKGSAIFLHLATPDFAPTAGCVALTRDDLLAVLAAADRDTRAVIG